MLVCSIIIVYQTFVFEGSFQKVVVCGWWQADHHGGCFSEHRAKNLNPSGHTRLPRYARGRTGVIEMMHGAHVYPDTYAHGLGENPQPLYAVRFTAQELWGPDASGSDSLCVDLWENYLEAAS